MKSLRSAAVSCTIALTLAAATCADTLTITSDRENTIFSEQTEFSNGSGDYFFAGQNNNGDVRRGLLRFDVSAIPAGSTINSVSLTLFCSRAKQGNHLVSLHRCNADWGEGASNAPAEEGTGIQAEDGDATWIYTFYNTTTPANSTPWTSPGGDFAPTASASIIVNRDGQFFTWTSTAALVSDVQTWVNTPAANYGWVLIGAEGNNRSARRFDTRIVNDVNNRPSLVIDFTPPASTGACCFDDGTCLLLSSADCTTQAGTYQGDGVPCTPNPCPQPTGACCFNDGTCLELSSADCTSQSGNYQGDGASCTPNPCSVVTGACCFDDGTCSELFIDDCITLGGTYNGDNTLCIPDLCPVILEPFVDALPIPAPATPTTGTIGGVATYDIQMLQMQQQLHRDLPPTTLWGYEGLYPGPTIEATSGNPVTVNWINDLRDDMGNLRTDHFLPVPLGPHGAQDLPKTVVHLHGGKVPPEADGDPEATFLPGQQDTYLYPNLQDAATLWYHDHALGITRLNVMMGLAGFYIIRDANEASLALPDGQYEIPLAIQDRSFRSDGSLKYPATYEEHFFGDTMLVNGKVWPFLNVDQGKYRLRLLNGCNSRTLTLALSNGAPFTQIGIEGGLLEQPVVLNEITLGPAERADVIVDFAPYTAGTEIILTNSAPAPFPGSPGVGVVSDVMKFIVQNAPGDTDPIPTNLRTIEFLQPANASQERFFELRKFQDNHHPNIDSIWLINGLTWNDITEFPLLGDTEIWTFVNPSGVMHPMHIHLVFFQVLERDTFTIGPGGEIIPDGNPTPPDPNEIGWKDTVRVNANELVRVIARFEPYAGRYPYHCHILEHEDHEMMREFEIIELCSGDINADKRTDLADFNILAVNFGSGPLANRSQGDLTVDGWVNLADFNILAVDFGCDAN